jgi:transcription elongation factor Elf1
MRKLQRKLICPFCRTEFSTEVIGENGSSKIQCDCCHRTFLVIVQRRFKIFTSIDVKIL